MRIKVIRKLNAHEKYACGVKDVKNIFKGEDVDIDFGLSRDFQFERKNYKKYKKPQIDGSVIVSASFYEKDLYRDYYALILFYAIKDEEYDAECKNIFAKEYLPAMYEWYQEMLAKPETAKKMSGADEFLVEWSHNGFKTHTFRYY